MKVRYHIEAVEEYDEAVDYYTEISPQLAASLIEEIERCIVRIGEHPFQAKEIQPHIHAVGTKVFPYQLVYMIERDAVTILAVSHEKRDPEYWLHRVN